MTVEEAVQRLGINRLSIGVDLRGDVTGTGLLGRHLHRVIWLGGVHRRGGQEEGHLGAPSGLAHNPQRPAGLLRKAVGLAEP